MKSPLLLAALCAATFALPAFGCVESHSLEGTLTIPFCDPKADADCVPAGKAVYHYTEILDIPGVYTIGLQTSPWRMYDGNDRILTIEELAALVRSDRTTHTRVHLVGSWTAKLPEGNGETLAQKLSAALDGFPVDGSDGFLWLTAKGGMRTTRQAFSMWKTGGYSVRKGDDVMLAMVPGAMAQFEDRFAADGDARGVVRAGVGHDAFMLCPDRALAAFERAAKMGSPIGAYNAALMHEQNGDYAKAIAGLERAVTLGDEKAKTRLAVLRKRGPVPVDE